MFLKMETQRRRYAIHE